MKDPNRIPTARQFFDVWSFTVALVSTARTYPLATPSYRAEAVARAAHRHGAWIGSRAGAMFDLFHNGARTGGRL